MTLLLALLLPQDVDALLAKYVAANTADRPAIEEKVKAAGKDALPRILAAREKEKGEKRAALRELFARCLQKIVVDPYIEKQFPKSRNAWEDLWSDASACAAFEKLAPEVTFFFLERGLKSPVVSSNAVGLVLAVSNDAKEITELKFGAPDKDVIQFVNRFFAGKDKAQIAAATAIVHPPCEWRFGQAWARADDFAAADTALNLKKESKPGTSGITYSVEFDGGAVKSVKRQCKEMHPRCHEHRAAALAFLEHDAPRLRVGDVIYLDLTQRALPDHYLYEALDGDCVVGFVLVMKNVKRCAYIDRATLERLPNADLLAPLLKVRRE